MFIVTIDNIPGREIVPIGFVKGEVVQSKHIGRDFAASFKSMVGGELKGYTEMMREARDIATMRMIAEAEKMQADAIVGVRYLSSAVLQGAAEVVAYGTAVKYVD